MADLTTAEQRVLDALDERELVDSIVELVRTPSVTGTDAEAELQHTVSRWLDSAGHDVDLWTLDLDELRIDPDFPGTEAPRLEGHGLVTTSPGEGNPGLILQGHVDVVPIGDIDKWEGGDPFSGHIDGDILHGRGACDMKAGFAVNVAVARALHRSGVRTERRLAIHSVISEEDGGLGAFATLRRGHRGDVAVITEPTSGKIVTANSGALTFRIEVAGRAAHGAARDAGVSAIEAFWPLMEGLRILETRRNTNLDPRFAGHAIPYGISIGTVHAGDWASSVPDLLVAEGRMGVRLDEDPREARLILERHVAEIAAEQPWLRDHPPSVTWPGGQFGPGRMPSAHPLLAEVTDAVAAVTGTEPTEGAAPYGSDLRLYNGIGGIPTLHYGPGDVRFAHAPRESVSITETIDCARALALLAARRLGAHL